MNEDKIIAGVTAIIGLAAMVFGMKQETVSVLQAAVPQVVGGVMAIVSVVTYLVNRRKAKEAVFSALVYREDKVSVRDTTVTDLAKQVGLL